MPNKLYTRSFNGGIISPEMFGRIDDLKANTGLAVCRNFIVLPQGPIQKRTGFRFVREVKDSAKRVRLIPFRFSSTQTMMLEFGEAYIRFHSFGATLLTPTSGIDAYDSAETYSQGDLVTESSKTWYAVADVPINTTPSSNVYSGTPNVSSSWVLQNAGLASVPSGYEFVGTSLPDTVTVGDQVAISRTTYDWTFVGNELEPDYEPVETTVYDTYDGESVTAPSGQWYELGTEYEIPSPYAEGDLFDIHYAQSGDILTLVHPKYPPYEVRRLGATTWTLVQSTFGSSLSAPTISSVTATTATSPSDTQSYDYVATSVSDDQIDESVASAVVSATNQLFDTGAKNVINFADAKRRNVYRKSAGIFGFIGQTDETSLTDDNIAPDVSRAPPLNQTPFASDYPRTVGYFEQRKVFAGTSDLPQTFSLTKTGTESNLDYSIPIRDNDAISIKIADLESSTIRHAVPVGDLILLTDSAEWKVSPATGGALTPTNISVRVQSRIGASNVQPVVVGTSIVYAAARGGHMRALGYDFDVNSYVSVDLSLRAAHLFDYKSIKDVAYAKGPVPIVWCVSSDELLLGLTYVPEQQVFAWHRHDTKGIFESCAAIEEGDDSILYVIVRRTIDGSTVRYVEALASSYFPNVKDYIGLDSCISYSGAAETAFSGLDHLEGEEVYALADGAVQGPFTVSSGAIALDHAAENVHVGLRVIADAKTLPMVAEFEAYLNATVKNITEPTVRVYRSGRFFAGVSIDNLREAKIRTVESYGDAPSIKSEEIPITVPGNWNDSGQILIRASDPLPLTVSAMTLKVSFGG